ncbi:restriction endonuclease subunit S [Empedobacter falsenii]
MKEGYKQTKIGLLPQDWEIQKINDFTKVTSGATPSTNKADFWGGDILWMNSGELNLKKIYDVEGRITELGFKSTSTKLLPKNCVLIGLAGQGKTRGTAAINKVELCTNQSIAAIWPNKITNESFLYYYLDSKYDDLRKLSTGDGGRGGLNLGLIGSFFMPIPLIEEQNVIANCLSTWDEAIEKQQKLIEAKEIRHKALMQKLLSGKKRLPGFSDESKEVKLGDFANSYSGLSGKNKDDFGTGKPYISYMNVFSNSIINNDIYDLVSISDHENQNKVQYGDILFTVSSETPTEAGMVSVYLNESSEDVYLNSFCFGVRLQTLDILNPRFASFLLRFDDFRKEVFKLAQGSTRYNISKSGILNIKFKIPTLEEQLSITKILESTEKEIEIEKKKVDQLKEQKKALMQKLLTGKVRLPLQN